MAWFGKGKKPRKRKPVDEEIELGENLIKDPPADIPSDPIPVAGDTGADLEALANDGPSDSKFGDLTSSDVTDTLSDSAILDEPVTYASELQRNHFEPVNDKLYRHPKARFGVTKAADDSHLTMYIVYQLPDKLTADQFGQLKEEKLYGSNNGTKVRKVNLIPKGNLLAVHFKVYGDQPRDVVNQLVTTGAGLTKKISQLTGAKPKAVDTEVGYKMIKDYQEAQRFNI